VIGERLEGRLHRPLELRVPPGGVLLRRDRDLPVGIDPSQTSSSQTRATRSPWTAGNLTQEGSASTPFQSRSTMALANSEVLTSVAPSICRAKS
jgi:hypothetical protein